MNKTEVASVQGQKSYGTAFLVGFSHFGHERKKDWQNPSKSNVNLFLSLGLEMNLTQISKSSQLRSQI